MNKDILIKLSKSKFRNNFKLTEKDLNYIKEKGLATIKEHAYNFITTRIAPQNIKNDGKQTPFKNHPVFVAQHATATCCRSCLYKWHHIPKNKKLTNQEITYIINLIMEWIENQLSKENINE